MQNVFMKNSKVPNTELAGYPANIFAGYRIFGLIVNIEFYFLKILESFSFQRNLPTFHIANSILLYLSKKFEIEFAY